MHLLNSTEYFFVFLFNKIAPSGHLFSHKPHPEQTTSSILAFLAWISPSVATETHSVKSSILKPAFFRALIKSG